MNARNEFERWLQNCTGDILDELKAMKHDDAKIEACFGHRQTFGTAGIRSIMAPGIACLNDFTVRQTARGLAAYMKTSGGAMTCAIGYDCRNNSTRFARICAASLAESGVFCVP